MRHSEWIAAAYFSYLLVPIWLSTSRRMRLTLVAWTLAMAGSVAVISQLPDASAWRPVRDWAPGLYLLAGYWLPGRLFTAPDTRLERWLIKADQFWRVPRMAAAVRLTPVLRDYLELAYLLCYPLVPMTFGVMYFIAPNDVARASMADRFWSPVLLGVFMCYGLLPWLPTRPPRAFLSDDAAFPMSRVRRLNHLVLRHASIQVNTFPSGHVAAALAAALAVRDVSPVTGLILGVLALSIAVAAVLGRYHYLADVILGALAAVLAFIVFR